MAACLAAIVTTFVGVFPDPQADTRPQNESCTLDHVKAWLTELDQPSQEDTPEHRLSITQAFLDVCPKNRHARRAHTVAAMAALDAGDTALSLDHFFQAGQSYDLAAQTYHITALLAEEQQHEAWRQRDLMVARWRQTLARRPEVTVEETQTKNGAILVLRSTSDDAWRYWVAIPNKAGWPASLGFNQSSIGAILVDLGAAPKTRAAMHRCSSRRLSAALPSNLKDEDLAAYARPALVAYLADPDKTAPRSYYGEVHSCVWPDLLLPGTTG